MTRGAGGTVPERGAGFRLPFLGLDTQTLPPKRDRDEGKDVNDGGR